MEELTSLLARGDTTELLDLLRQYLDRAYRDAGDRFDPQIGCDGRTYGMDVYTFCWFRIEEGSRFHVTENEPKWLRLGDFDVAVHRVGQTHLNIDNSFPGDRRDWPANTFGELPFKPQRGVTGKKMLVVAHMGNAKEGLLAAYLCVPQVLDGNLASWLFTHRIWAKTEPEGASKVRPVVDSRPPEEQKEKAKVVRRKKKGTGGEADDAQ